MLQMKKIQYSYLPADSSSTSDSTEIKKGKHPGTAKMPPPPDEATVARLNAMAREYPYCAWGKPKNNTLL
jgi:hypothetical protein